MSARIQINDNRIAIEDYSGNVYIASLADFTSDSGTIDDLPSALPSLPEGAVSYIYVPGDRFVAFNPSQGDVCIAGTVDGWNSFTKTWDAGESWIELTTDLIAAKAERETI